MDTEDEGYAHHVIRLSHKKQNERVPFAAAWTDLEMVLLLLLLLLRRFSRVRLCATPQTAAHQAPRPWDFPGKNTGVGCIAFSDYGPIALLFLTCILGTSLDLPILVSCS